MVPGEHLPYDVEKGKATLNLLKKISDERNVSMSQAALNYSLKQTRYYICYNWCEK